MYTLRTRFGKDIVAEFLPPARPTKKQRVIILCGGMPGSPGKKDQLDFFSKKGFWVINPRYRGTWESSGKFLQESPHKDVLTVIDNLPKGFIDLWSKKKYGVNPDLIFIIGTSFGGPAALLASLDPRVNKIIAISPVIDWTVRSPEEPLNKLFEFTAAAFGRAYEMSKKNFDKLRTGKFYNPTAHESDLDKNKIFNNPRQR
jgi:alpha-beta hydrolase superfamily lysophospholipase